MQKQAVGNPRIGIVGAGASGLSAAYHLKQAGHTDVTVLEADRRVGGKCCSVTVGSRVYELGAVLGHRDYSATLELMDSVGIEGGPLGGLHFYDLDGRPTAFPQVRQVPHLAWQLLTHYAWLSRGRFRRVNRPGLAGLSGQLSEPFAEFAGHHGLGVMESAVATWFTGFGYGWFDEVPTAYVMKYLDLPMIEASYLGNRRFSWPDGAESLWSRLAERYDVRTGAAVRRVTRSETVTVETDAGQFEFDELILTGPLDEAVRFLDADATERRLFSQIRYYEYDVLLCRITGLPPGGGAVPANFRHDRAGHPMIWYRREEDDPLCTVYVLGDGTQTLHQIEQTCAADIERLGGHLREVVATRRWRYFPHVTPEVMAAGYYDELEALQGTRHTYYAGEVMSFATIEHCIRYSRDLVERFFTPSAAGQATRAA